MPTESHSVFDSVRPLPGPGQIFEKFLLPDEIDRVWEQTRQAYQEQLSAYYSTSELWDDGIIDPVDTRNALGIAISVSLNAPLGDPGYGVFRF